MAVRDVTWPPNLYRRAEAVEPSTDIVLTFLLSDRLHDKTMLVNVATESNVSHPIGIDVLALSN